MATNSEGQQGLSAKASESPATQDAEVYFNSYNDLAVHQLMLKDRPRTLAYRNFFETHRDAVKGKVVLDIGAGTGILSLFAAVAGARKVYAVEASDVATLCQEVVEENELDGTIEVIHGAVEDIELPTKVDVIVSEWMGFYLLHESMLDSVIVARDKFLSSDGIMAPSHATILVAPVDMSEHFQDRADEWSNIYGFDFSPVASAINMNEVGQPLVECLSPDILRSEPRELLSLDLKTVTQEEVRKFTTRLEFAISVDTKIHGFACWFDAEFHGKVVGEKNGSDSSILSRAVDGKGDAKSVANPSTSSVSSNDSLLKSEHDAAPSAPIPTLQHGSGDATRQSQKIVSLKTGPMDPPTHWKQTVIFLPQTILVGAGLDLPCRMTMAQDSHSNKRHYNITVALTSDEDDESVGEGAESDASDDSARDRLISALIEKYDTEHEELGDEAQLVEVNAEVDAARELDEAIEKEGWPMDASTSSAPAMDDD